MTTSTHSISENKTGLIVFVIRSSMTYLQQEQGAFKYSTS